MSRPILVSKNGPFDEERAAQYINVRQIAHHTGEDEYTLELMAVNDELGEAINKLGAPAYHVGYINALIKGTTPPPPPMQISHIEEAIAMHMIKTHNKGLKYKIKTFKKRYF